MSDDKQVTETPATSPVEEEASDKEPVDEGVNEESQPDKTETKSEDEIAYNSLSGSAQERFRYMAQRAKEAEEKARELQEKSSAQAQIDNSSVSYGTDEVQKAIKTLRQGGVATVDDLRYLFDTIESKRVHDKLEDEYSGKDGGPKYDRELVEGYAKKNGMGSNYRAAFRDMFFDELADASRSRQKKKSVYTEKPTASSTEKTETLTLDGLREKLRGEKGMEYYNKLAQNPEEFDKLLRQLTK